MNEQEIESRFEDIGKRLTILENKLETREIGQGKKLQVGFSFKDKNKTHNILLEELLQSDYCHSKNGLVKDEILKIFKENGRPVNPKKISDLLYIWKNRQKIEAIKTKGEKQKRYFWIDHE